MAIDALVVVHPDCVTQPKVRNNMEGWIKTFRDDQIFYSGPTALEVEDIPKNSRKEPLPKPGDLDFIYVVGAYRDQCVYVQIDYLKNKGYRGKIIPVDSAIQN